MRLDLIQQVLARHELDKACQEAFGCSADELRDRAVIGKAICEWGEAMKWFVYKCVSPNGRVDGHFSYVDLDPNGGFVCSFCKLPHRTSEK